MPRSAKVPNQGPTRVLHLRKVGFGQETKCGPKPLRPLQDRAGKQVTRHAIMEALQYFLLLRSLLKREVYQIRSENTV